MGKSCLITQNLITAVSWYMGAPSSIVKPEHGGDGELTWKKKAWLDLNALLKRDKQEFNPDSMNGVNFEKKVYTIAALPESEVDRTVGSPEFHEVCDAVRGMQFGVKGGRDYTIGELKCFVYAKFDAILLPKIKDIKTTGSYKKNKYLESVQHPLYCFIKPECEEFEYIIVEWDTYPKIKKIHREVYKVPKPEVLEYEVRQMIMNCFDDLKMLKLWDVYRESYCLY